MTTTFQAIPDAIFNIDADDGSFGLEHVALNRRETEEGRVHDVTYRGEVVGTITPTEDGQYEITISVDGEQQDHIRSAPQPTRATTSACSKPRTRKPSKRK